MAGGFRLKHKIIRPEVTPSVKAYSFDTFPKGTALEVAASFPALPKGVPLGELARSA